MLNGVQCCLSGVVAEQEIIGSPDGMIPAVKLALACLLLTVSAACGVLDPRLPPQPPAPNLDPGLVLLEIPPEEVGLLAHQSVRESWERGLPELRRRDPDLVRRILAGQVTVGMTEQQVIWVFMSHPTRTRALGPPGGSTYLWEPGRYFVRFGAEAQAIQAGRY